jgi:POT family proton-dependent oligopeptide transporter
LSNYAIKDINSTSPLLTNAGYSHTFFWLGIASIICGIILVMLIPFLRRLLNEHQHKDISGIPITPPSA